MTMGATGSRSRLTFTSPCAAVGSPRISDGDSTAGFRQVPRRHQAVAAVVALAAQHHDAPALGQFTQNEAGRGAAGVLHQFQGGDPEAVRGDPIGDPHLVSGQYLHLNNRRAFLGL